MKRFLILMLCSSVAVAAPSLLDLLKSKDRVQPLALLKNIERQYTGTIVEFETDIEDGELVYEVDIVNPEKKKTIELDIRGRDGHILKEKAEKIEADDMDELAVVKLLQKKDLIFSEVVEQAMENNSAYLLEAQLDRDIGINYIELKVVSEQGKSKLAFDLNTMKQLPLLRWN